MRDEEDLDLLINSALSSYGAPGPGSGLEQRILAHVIDAPAVTEFKTAKPRRRWLWLLALPAASCLLLFMVVPKAPQQKPDQSRPAPQPEQPAVAASRIEQSAPLRSKKVHHIAVPAQAAKPQLTEISLPQPKLNVFPTPRPLTPQERALVAVATRTPPSQRKSLLAAQKAGDAPINIAAIYIDPLEMPDEGKN